MAFVESETVELKSELVSDICKEIAAFANSGTGQTVFQDRREFQGSLFQQMEEVYAYLDLRNQTRAIFEGLYRIDSRDYPEVALREALMNCRSIGTTPTGPVH